MPGAAGPVLYVKYSQTIGAGTSSGNKQFHQLGARIAGQFMRGRWIAGPFPVDRWARIAARGSHALDRSRWIAGPLRRAAARAGRFPVICLGISGRGPLGVFYAFFTGHKKTRRPLLAGGRY